MYFLRDRNWIFNFYLHFMVQCVNCEFRCTGAGAFHSGFVRDRVGELEPPPTKELEQSSSTTNTKIRVSNGKNFYSNFL